MTLPTLTYFSSRGRAELIRLVCAEAGVAYEEKSLGVYHPVDRTPAFNALKETGTLPFDAVPIWDEADGFRLAQSDAIVRHLAREHGLYGRTTHEASRCDMIHSGMEDTRLTIRALASTDPAKRPALREELVQTTLPRWLTHFERLLVMNGDGRGFVVGEAPSFADAALFLLFENIRDNELDGAYALCPALVAHAGRMAARSGIARYLASPQRFPVQLLPR
ncbi:MAG: glutathione S-transferase family protein [Byssovorax sp.]